MIWQGSLKDQSQEGRSDGTDSVPEGMTVHWRSKKTTGSLERNGGIFLDIHMESQGIFNGVIGNYIYQNFPGYGAHYAAYPDLQRRVCGKLDLETGTGVLIPEGEELTHVTVKHQGDTLVVTFVERLHLEGYEQADTTMWEVSQFVFLK